MPGASGGDKYRTSGRVLGNAPNVTLGSDEQQTHCAFMLAVLRPRLPSRFAFMPASGPVGLLTHPINERAMVYAKRDGMQRSTRLLPGHRVWRCRQRSWGGCRFVFRCAKSAAQRRSCCMKHQARYESVRRCPPQRAGFGVTRVRQGYSAGGGHRE